MIRTLDAWTRVGAVARPLRLGLVRPAALVRFGERGGLRHSSALGAEPPRGRSWSRPRCGAGAGQGHLLDRRAAGSGEVSALVRATARQPSRSGMAVRPLWRLSLFLVGVTPGTE